MNVTELIERLSKVPGNLTVVQSRDAEGNTFSPLDEFCTGRYLPDNTWSGEFDSDPDEEDINAICFWPTN